MLLLLFIVADRVDQWDGDEERRDRSNSRLGKALRQFKSQIKKQLLMSESANTRLLKMKEKNDNNKVIMTLMIGEMEFQKMLGRNWLGNSGDDWPHETSITAREGVYGYKATQISG